MNKNNKKSFSSYFIKLIMYYKGSILGEKSRIDLINALIDKYNYKSYLEIGIQDGQCLKRIHCSDKTGVDPFPMINSIKNTKIIKQTSDEFFKDCNEKYDLIFIDGLHTYEQAYIDFINAVERLNLNGRIVIHDCNPISEERSISFSEGGKWNGDVYKTIIKIRSLGDYTIQTIDIDNGCGVIELKPSNKLQDYELNYNWLAHNRKKAINLISWEDFVKSP